MRKLILMLCIPLGIIGCRIEKQKEPPKSQPEVRAAKVDSICATSTDPDVRSACGQIDSSRSALKLTQINSCSEVLGLFGEVTTVARLQEAEVSKLSIDSLHAAKLLTNLRKASDLVVTQCKDVIAAVDEGRPNLRKTYEDAVYYQKHGKLPPQPQNDTPAKVSRG